jgi:hypothetical protein
LINRHLFYTPTPGNSIDVCAIQISSLDPKAGSEQQVFRAGVEL